MQNRLTRIKDTNELAAIIEKRLLKVTKERKLSPALSNEGFFCNDTKDEEIPKFTEVLEKIVYSFEKTDTREWNLNYVYKESTGTAKAMLLNQYDPNKPSLIFHHGLGDTQYKIQARLLTNSAFLEIFNVFAIRAGRHSSIKEFRTQCMDKFINFETATAASIHLMEEIRKVHKSVSNKPLVITGFSMGGILTGWHYFYYNTADFYFPIIAYPNFSEIIFSKEHSSLINNYDEKAKNSTYVESYKLPENLLNRDKSNIKVFLGSQDEIVFFDKAQKFWEGYDTKVFPVGHYGIAIKMREIRHDIKEKVFGN